MNNIMKCDDNHCPSRNNCLRYTIKTSNTFEYYIGSHREIDADNCEMFKPNKL